MDETTKLRQREPTWADWPRVIPTDVGIVTRLAPRAAVLIMLVFVTQGLVMGYTWQAAAPHITAALATPTPTVTPLRLLPDGAGLWSPLGDGALYFHSSGLTLQPDDPAAAPIALAFVGNDPATLAGEVERGEKVSYFIGQAEDEWQSALPTYEQVRYTGLYPDIELVYSGSLSADSLKSTFYLAPQADPTLIRWRYPGAQVTLVGGALHIDHDGDGTPDLIEQPPVAWTLDGERQRPVHIEYTLAEDGTIGFALGDYSAAYPLVIDPVLGYSTVMGSTGTDNAFSIATDAAGFSYIVGETDSVPSSFVSQTLNQTNTQSLGTVNTIIAKLDPNGAVVWTAYLGGSANDRGQAIAIDPDSNPYIVGETQSADFPVTANAPQNYFRGDTDVFITKLRADGSAIVWSTFYGASGNDRGRAIVVNDQFNAFVVGRTGSGDFPLVQAIQGFIRGGEDTFVLRLSADGRTIWFSTFLGGNALDVAKDVALDSDNNIYITGYTESTDFPDDGSPVQPNFGGERDAFVMKVDPSGRNVLYSTYLGGSGLEEAHAIQVAPDGSVYIAGGTSSQNFPRVAALQNSYAGGLRDAFVSHISSTGSQLLFSTYLGGEGDEQIFGLARAPNGALHVAGYTWSNTFPVIGDAFQPTKAGGVHDGFVARIEPDLTLGFSSFLGGSGEDLVIDLALDAAGNQYVTGYSDSPDFPRLGAGAEVPRGTGNDIFIARVGAATLPTSTAPATNTSVPSPTFAVENVPATITPLPPTATTPPPTPDPLDITRTVAPAVPLPTQAQTGLPTWTPTSPGDAPAATPGEALATPTQIILTVVPDNSAASGLPIVPLLALVLFLVIMGTLVTVLLRRK